MMRRFITPIILVLITLLILTSTAFATDAGKEKAPKKKFSQEELEARHKQIDLIMIEKHQGKISEAEALGKLAAMNIYQIEKKESVNPMSNKNYCIDLLAPMLFLDDDTGLVYAKGEFYWNGSAYWQADFPSPWPAQPGEGVDIGGNDGFGIVFNKSVTISSSNFYTFDQHGNSFYTRYPSKKTTSGVGYTEQDVGFKSSNGTYDYSWDNGFVSAYFSTDSTNGLAAWTEMSHTWDTSSVSITGISLPLGISWQYNNYTYNWDINGPTGYY